MRSINQVYMARPFSEEITIVTTLSNFAHRVITMVPKPMLGLSRLNLDRTGQVVVAATPGNFHLRIIDDNYD